MGYDMHWVRRADDDRSYFRLNIWGMSRYCEAMGDLGVLRVGYDLDAPAWPEDISDGYWDWKYEDAEVDEATRMRYQAIEDQYQARLIWSPPGPVAGIPAHKFSTNDGWIVTPEECFFAASTIRATDPDEVSKVLAASGINDTGYWDQWVQWLADASEHGGFEVH